MRIRDNKWNINEKVVFDIVEFPDYPIHDSIWAMTIGIDGKIYFALGAEGKGEVARLMVYDPQKKKVSELADIGKITKDFLKEGKIPNSKLHFSLCADSDGKIYGATHPTANPPGENLFEPFGTFANIDYGHTGGFVICYDPSSGKTENLGLITPGEGIRTMILDKERKILYGITYPRVHFFSFDLNKQKFTDFGRVAMLGSFDLLIDKKGNVYGTNDAGDLYKYDPIERKISDLSLTIPGLSFRRSSYNFLWYPFYPKDVESEWLYGGSYYDGHLFRYNPCKGKEGIIQDLGYGWGEEPSPGVWATDYIQAPEFGKNNKIYYGFSGMWEGSNLVCFDTESQEKVDLGKIYVDGLTSAFLSCSTSSEDGTFLYFADITIEAKARLLVIKPNQEFVDEAIVLQKNSKTKKTTIYNGPSVKEDFDLQSSEIMPVTPNYRKNAFAFVEEGLLSIRELNFYGVSPSIPHGECAISALVLGKDNRLYGTTSGSKAHLFVYDPYTLNEHVIDLGTLGKEKETCNMLICDEDGKIFGGTSPSGFIFSYDPSEDYSIFWVFKKGKIDLLDPPVTNDGILTLLPEVINKTIYGLTKKGKLFSINIVTGNSEVLAELSYKHLSRVLIRSENKIFGSVSNGSIFTFDMNLKKLETMSLKIPAAKGRDFQNFWDSAVKDEQGLIYGGTAEGYIFTFNPELLKITCLGKPIADFRIRALTFGTDGNLFGIAGTPGRISHLFRYNPLDRSLRDLGIPAVNFPKPWVGYEFNAMVTSPEGFLYLGESDRISHLFIYSPRYNKQG